MPDRRLLRISKAFKTVDYRAAPNVYLSCITMHRTWVSVCESLTSKQQSPTFASLTGVRVCGHPDHQYANILPHFKVTAGTNLHAIHVKTHKAALYRDRSSERQPIQGHLMPFSSKPGALTRKATALASATWFQNRP